MVVFFPLCQLLANSKIISLDLPVKDVYKKIWCPEGEVCGPYLKCLYYAFEGKGAGVYIKFLFIEFLFYRVNQ